MGFLDYVGLGGIGFADNAFGSITGTGGPDVQQYMGNADLAQFGANPYSSALAKSISAMPKYNGISEIKSTFTPDAYKAKDMSQAAMPQYDAIRARLNTQYNQTQQQSQEAIDRQFAAMGGGPGGAQIKQTENLASSIAKQKGDDLNSISAQEAQARQDLQNQENQKEFQSGETQKGYGFAADQSAKQQELQAMMFDKQMQQGQDQFEKQFNFGANSTIAGLNTAWDQAQAESRNNEFNKQIALHTAKHSGGMLGGGGFMGSGVFT